MAGVGEDVDSPAVPRKLMLASMSANDALFAAVSCCSAFQPRTEPDEEHFVVELNNSEAKTQVRLQPEAVFGSLIHVRASE
jgi:hypothetical protein